jgi:hypothetical protein
MQPSNSRLAKRNPIPEKKVAFLWDESFLWGVMAYKALKSAGLPFELVRAEDMRNGCLDRYSLLFVPGGWASNKIKALGDSGIEAIKKFVQAGSHYLGFCGGAGLATEEGIGLLPIKRRPTKDRVPSFSGKISLNLEDHPIWNNIPLPDDESRVLLKDFKKENALRITHHASPVFHAWWPSQFVTSDTSLKILASYGEALPDAFSSDLNTGDIENYGDWTGMEKLYGINLDPKRLLNEPAVIEGSYGKGSVILSLIHFDTPGDVNGTAVLKNLWEYLADYKPESGSSDFRDERKDCAEISPYIKEIQDAVSELITFGSRNFLWFWRNPMLLQWRRGVRGLEHATLYILVREIAELSSGLCMDNKTEELLLRIRNSLLSFSEKAKRLLLLERSAMSVGHITYETCDSPEIREIRSELFSTSKSHGGLFKELVSELDSYLYGLLSSGSD